jgi:hypothetical protein
MIGKMLVQSGRQVKLMKLNRVELNYWEDRKYKDEIEET